MEDEWMLINIPENLVLGLAVGIFLVLAIGWNYIENRLDRKKKYEPENRKNSI
jgi:hypothetical protein